MAKDRTVAAMVVIGLGLLAVHVVLGAMVGAGYAIPTTIIGALAAAAVLRGPVGQALARRIHGGEAELPPETVLSELEELRNRVLELEERVDFSERLLAQARPESGRER